MSDSSYYGSNLDFYTEDTIPDRIGRGSSVDEFMRSGEINITNGIKRITESFKDILSTPVGTRFFCPQYGSKLNLLMFEQNDFVVRDLAESYVKEALEEWEPRVKIDEVKATIDKKVLEIDVKYFVKDTGTPGSFVYTIERKVPDLN